jgi:hypothetical protein
LIVLSLWICEKNARPGIRRFLEGEDVDLGISDSRLAGGSSPTCGGVCRIVLLLALCGRLINDGRIVNQFIKKCKLHEVD